MAIQQQDSVQLLHGPCSLTERVGVDRERGLVEQDGSRGWLDRRNMSGHEDWCRRDRPYGHLQLLFGAEGATDNPEQVIGAI